jgi:succinate dehydrogenase / fumarate reductase membrane anchor subunit
VVFNLHLVTIMKFFESGTNEFIIVRACAMLMFLYISYLMYFIVSTPTVDYNLWKTFFEGSITRIFSSVFLIAFAIHTWFGTWAIGSDYFTPARLGDFSKIVYSSYRIFCFLVISVVLIWSFLIIW